METMPARSIRPAGRSWQRPEARRRGCGRRGRCWRGQEIRRRDRFQLGHDEHGSVIIRSASSPPHVNAFDRAHHRGGTMTSIRTNARPTFASVSLIAALLALISISAPTESHAQGAFARDDAYDFRGVHAFAVHGPDPDHLKAEIGTA